MSEPRPARRADSGHRLYRYEMRVRTTVTPALARSFPGSVDRAVVPGHAVRRLAVIRDEDDGLDLAAVVARLNEWGVAVVSVRCCRPVTTRVGRAP